MPSTDSQRAVAGTSAGAAAALATLSGGLLLALALAAALLFGGAFVALAVLVAVVPRIALAPTEILR